MVSRSRRAKSERGGDAGSADSPSIGATEDDAADRRAKRGVAKICSRWGRPNHCQAGHQLAVLDDDRFEDVRALVASVDGILQRLVDVFPADDHQGVGAVGEERRDPVVYEAVALVL